MPRRTTTPWRSACKADPRLWCEAWANPGAPLLRPLEVAARIATFRLGLAVGDAYAAGAQPVATLAPAVCRARAAWRSARAELLRWYRSQPRKGRTRRSRHLAQRLRATCGDGAFRRAHLVRRAHLELYRRSERELSSRAA